MKNRLLILATLVATLFSCGDANTKVSSTDSLSVHSDKIPKSDSIKTSQRDSIKVPIGDVAIEPVSECKAGKLTGKVTFHGVPCPGEKNIKPPCQGPYPDYKVEVYSGKTLVKTTTTNKSGQFTLCLDPGNYYIKTQDGIDPAENIKNNPFKIENGKTTNLSLEVDTGIQ